jgi:FkbH-like protein
VTTAASPSPWNFAVSATFTAEPLEPVLSYWGRYLNSSFAVRFAPFNQPLQTLLDSGGIFGRNTHGVNVLLVRLEDLIQFEDDAVFARLEANLRQLVDAVQCARDSFPVPLIVCVCPASPGFIAKPGAAEFCHRMTAWMEANLEGVSFLRHEDVERLYPVTSLHSSRGEQLGRIPYSDLYFGALGTAVVRYAHAILSPPYKVIALDCDDTLWDGICGEDGPSGVNLDGSRRRMQQFLLDQRESGMLLCLASKNNEQDVFDTFALHPEMPLQLKHFAGWRLDWRSKTESLPELAAELGLGLESFIFIDDNPKECAEVENGLPEVLSLALPEDISKAPRFLEHVWAFDHPIVTDEDRHRADYYEQKREFGREVRKTPDLREFKAALNLEVKMERLASERLPRAAQLTQRTNQFHCAAIRRSAPEIQTLMDKGYECYTASVSDRFGDYGLVGLLIVRPHSGRLEVDTFLLSCRALGRGVEHRMLSWLAAEAQRRGFKRIEVRFVPAARNRPAQDFLESIPSGSRTEESFLFPAAELRNLDWEPSAAALPDGPKPPVSRAPRRAAPGFARIARELSTAEAVLAGIRRDSVRHADLAASTDPPRTGVERALALIWAELLQIRSVSRTDNFFDLGGHSLLAVVLLLRIKETLGVEVSIDDVYSANMTLETLASAVEAARYSQANPQEYEALLAEIESLSDGEVCELLSREGIRPEPD